MLRSPEQASSIAEALVERGIAAGRRPPPTRSISASARRACRCGSARLEDVSRSEGEEIGLRLFVGQRSATAASSDLSDDALGVLGRALPGDGQGGARGPVRRARADDLLQRGAAARPRCRRRARARSRPSFARARSRRRRPRWPSPESPIRAAPGRAPRHRPSRLRPPAASPARTATSGHGCSAAVDRRRGRDDAARPCVAQRAPPRRPRSADGDRAAGRRARGRRGSTRRGPSPANIRCCSTRASRRACSAISPARSAAPSIARKTSFLQDKLGAAVFAPRRHDRRRSAAAARPALAAVRRRGLARSRGGSWSRTACSTAGSRKAPRPGSSASRRPAMRARRRRRARRPPEQSSGRRRREAARSCSPPFRRRC